MRQRLFFTILFIIGLAIGAFYFAIFLHDQHPTFGHVASSRLLLFIVFAVIIQLAAHLLRAYKSRLLINAIRPAKTGTLFRGLSVGFLFNALLPLRLGEIVRAFYIGDELAISKTAVFISIIIERIVDGLLLGICFITAGLLIHNASPTAASYVIRVGIGVLAISILLALAIFTMRSERSFILRSVHSVTSLFNDKLAARLRFITWSGIYGTRLMLANKKSLIRFTILSVGMWLLYFGSTALIALAYLTHVSGSKLWFVTQSSYVGVSAPAGPGYIGSFHLIVSNLLEKVHIASASGFSLILWLVMVAPISLVGLVVLARQRFEKKVVKDKDALLINKLYRERNISQELAHFLDSYFKGERINQILTQAELDNKFKLIKSFRGGSHAHTMLVWQDENMRVKKLALPQYAEKLEEQAKWLIERSGLKHIPDVVGQEKTEHHYYFDLTYRDEFYPFFDYIHSHTPAESFKIMQKVLRFMNKSIYKEQKSHRNRQNLLDYIDSKVLQKATDTASMSNAVNKLMAFDKLDINGVYHHNLVHVIDKIKHNRAMLKDLAAYNESPIHGDLTIDNLIVTDEGDFLILDPNNENQVSSRVVDLGKLYQSLHSGYEFLIELEQCVVKSERITFEDSKSHKYAELFDLLDKKLKKELPPEEYRAILFHEAVHYCRMLTYRVNINPHTVPIFYATAVKLFNEFVDQYN